MGRIRVSLDRCIYVKGEICQITENDINIVVAFSLQTGYDYQVLIIVLAPWPVSWLVCESMVSREMCCRDFFSFNFSKYPILCHIDLYLAMGPEGHT